jgi:hypothetical protein
MGLLIGRCRRLQTEKEWNPGLRVTCGDTNHCIKEETPPLSYAAGAETVVALLRSAVQRVTSYKSDYGKRELMLLVETCAAEVILLALRSDLGDLVCQQRPLWDPLGKSGGTTLCQESSINS